MLPTDLLCDPFSLFSDEVLTILNVVSSVRLLVLDLGELGYRGVVTYLGSNSVDVPPTHDRGRDRCNGTLSLESRFSFRLVGSGTVCLVRFLFGDPLLCVLAIPGGLWVDCWA